MSPEAMMIRKSRDVRSGVRSIANDLRRLSIRQGYLLEALVCSWKLSASYVIGPFSDGGTYQ